MRNPFQQAAWSGYVVVGREAILRSDITLNEARKRDGSLHGNLTVELVTWLLDRQPTEPRLAVWLHYGEGLPFQDVAYVLSTSERTARKWSAQCLGGLREELVRMGLHASLEQVTRTLSAASVQQAPVGLLASIREVLH